MLESYVPSYAQQPQIFEKILGEYDISFHRIKNDIDESRRKS